MKQLLSALTLLGLGCNTSMMSGSTVKVGVYFAQTGPGSSVGITNIDTVGLAIDEVNKAGGVLDGLKLEAVLADTKSTVEGAKAAAEDLVAAKVPLVIGEWSSARTQQGIRVFAPAKVAQIAVGSSPAISAANEPDDGYFFRTAPSDAYQGRLLARRAIEKGFTKVAILHMPGAYGEGLADSFEEAFVALGGSIIRKVQYAEEQQSYVAELNQIFMADAATKAICLFGYSADGATVIKDYNLQFSSKGVTWFFTDGVEEEAFITGVGASNWGFDHEGSGVATPVGPKFDAFVSAFRAKYNRDPEVGTSSANVYDGAIVGLLALQAGGAATGTAIRDALQSVSSGGETFTHTQFKEAVAALKAGRDIDYDGISGVVDFDSTGEVTAAYHLWKIEAGKIKITVESTQP